MRFSICCLILILTLPFARSSELGAFTDQSDIGHVNHAGAARFDHKTETFSITGSGDNMWFTNDAFHFVWTKARGDLSLAADIHWPGTNGNAHRKACVIFRQTLEPDSAYADVAVHGNGLTSLQYRESPGSTTREIQSNVSAPHRVRLEKRGDYVTMSVAAAGAGLVPAGDSLRIHFAEPFYVGLGVCAHDSNAVAQAEFSHLELAPLSSSDKTQRKVESALETAPKFPPPPQTHAPRP